LTVADISWFGRGGPYAAHAGSDLVCRALAGLVQLVGPAEGPPLVAADFQAMTMGGLAGAIAVLAALFARGRGAAGRALEVSVLEAAIAYAELQTADAYTRGEGQARQGINRFWPTYPVGIYPTADGWLGVTLVTPAQWRGFCAMLGLDDLGADPGLITGLERQPRAAELEARFMPKLREHTAAHWFAEALRRRLPIVPVPDLAALRRNDELRARGAVVDIEAGGRRLAGIGSPLRLTRTPPRRGGTVPALGGARPSPRPKPPPGRDDGIPPLAGLRIVDLSMGWAGPLASRLMADLGADVIKIEACQYPDWWRGVDYRPHVLAEKLYEKAGRFNALNRNKRGITLDLTTPEGVAAAKALVAGADAVIENYAAGVLEKLGLDHAALARVNPSLVMLSMCAFGAASRWRECRAYGSTLEHASGLPHLAGRPDDPPVMGHIAYGDATGGLNGAAALLVALLHRQRTGEGQHIDLAQVECMLPMMGPDFLAASAGIAPVRRGNRHPGMAPHGIFPCAGEDRWIAVSVADDAMWQRCATAIGRPDLALSHPTLAARQADEDMIEAALAAWTRQHDMDAAMFMLQRAGVAAGAVRAPLDLFADPHLAARGFWQYVERRFVGAFPQSVPPFRENGAPCPIRSPAPTLGEHTGEVLRGLLGYDDATLADLARRHVTGTEAVPPRPRN
jgi:crotonobetainyl-CoA:carnitine CoA-transferase CaiB-like acyl-CoA transferase